MDIQAYIETGMLELYVYGLLDDDQNREVIELARKHREINDEIIAIERAILQLSSSFSPHLSAEMYHRVRERTGLKYGKIEVRKRKYFPMYVGWAAALLLLGAIGVQYVRLDEAGKQVAIAQAQQTKLQEQLVTSEIRNKATQDALATIRDKNTSVITLGGQAVSPHSYAKVFYNKVSATVYIDAKGLPEPPEGKVYQIWALKLNPLTPTSIGLLEDFKTDTQRIFAVDKAAAAEGFGITLEPAGGSASPTMDQLYALGKV